jgi:hypothetical protein
VREDGVGEIAVILNQIPFGQASLREENLVRIADRDVHGPESCAVLLNQGARARYIRPCWVFRPREDP